MKIEGLSRILAESWESSLSDTREPEKQQKERKKRVFFLSEKEVKPENQVIFENSTFFVERRSEFLVIRPKTVKEYLQKIRGTNRTIKVERGANDILVPLRAVAENPILWFQQRYVVQGGKQTIQRKFIREVWKYRNEVFPDVLMG